MIDVFIVYIYIQVDCINIVVLFAVCTCMYIYRRNISQTDTYRTPTRMS